jgi:uncharacterized protein YegP (UPF0339 family)
MAAYVVTKVEVYVDASGEHRWRARAGNGEIVADSAEGYVNRSDAVDMAARLFPDMSAVDAPLGETFEKSGAAVRGSG